MLKLENVTYSYPLGQVALENISLDFGSGSCLGLIGASGAGKSTLLQVMLGLLRPQEGLVSWEKQPLKYQKQTLKHHFQQVGMIFQNPDTQLILNTVFDDVAYGCLNMGMNQAAAKEAVKAALVSVNLCGFEDRSVQHLSFGEKKRVAMAGILAMGHPVILLDEPTAGLDPGVTDQMIILIKDLVAGGKKVLIASHDMDLIYALCDSVSVLKQGQLIKEGSADAVFSDIKSLESAGLKQPWLVALKTLIGEHGFKDREAFFNQWSQEIKR